MFALLQFNGLVLWGAWSLPDKKDEGHALFLAMCQWWCSVVEARDIPLWHHMGLGACQSTPACRAKRSILDSALPDG
jgi:hypothetical protein